MRLGLVAEPVAALYCSFVPSAVVVVAVNAIHLLSDSTVYFRWKSMVDLASSPGELLHVPPRHRGIWGKRGLVCGCHLRSRCQQLASPEPTCKVHWTPESGLPVGTVLVSGFWSWSEEACG